MGIITLKNEKTTTYTKHSKVSNMAIFKRLGFGKAGYVVDDVVKKTMTDPGMLVPGYNIVKVTNTIARSIKELIDDSVPYSKLPVGAALAVRRGIKGISHWGIYAGNKEVIHYVGGVVRKTH